MKKTKLRKRYHKKKKTTKKRNNNRELIQSFKSINTFLSDNKHKGENESYIKYYQSYSNGENVFTYFYVLKKTNSDITENLCLPDNKLFYDYKNHLFTDKQIDKVYSIFHLTVFFIYDIKKIVAPKNYKKSILNCKERFVLTSCNIQWGIREWSGAHQTILLYDNKNNTVELFDPEYTYLDDIEYDNTIKTFINKNFKNKYKYLGTKYTSHPIKKYGPQISVDAFSGLCTAWSIMYVQLRLLNPDKPPSFVVNKMMEGTQNKRKEKLLKFTKNIKSTIKDNVDIISVEII